MQWIVSQLKIFTDINNFLEGEFQVQFNTYKSCNAFNLDKIDHNFVLDKQKKA